MSGNSMGNNPQSGLIGSSLTGGSGLSQQSLTATAVQQQYQQMMNQWDSTSTSSTFTAPDPLDPKTASDLIAQLEHDKVIVADHKLLFGQHMGKSLRDVPIEYIVQLGAALRGARQQIAKELKRRRCVDRLTHKGG